MAIAELVMPKLGESIMEATILKWHKQVGDSVAQDETVLDIATDKVDSEVPSTAAGIISEILFNTNDVVPIGTVIARIKIGVDESLENIAIQPDQPIHKAIAEPEEVTIPISVPEQTNHIEAIDPLTVMAEAFYAKAEVPFTPLPITQKEEVSESALPNRFYSPLVLNIANSENVPLSELERIPGTGNDGRVSKKDILLYITDKKSGKQTASNLSTQATVLDTPIKREPTPVLSEKRQTPFIPASYSGKLSDPNTVVLKGSVEIIEMDRMRKLIAKHMVNSVQTSPHVTSFAEADVTNMVRWRQNVKEEFEKREGTKLTFTPMFIECIVTVMKRFPLINCSLDGDKIIIKQDINIGMATALPTGNLIVPVIKGADQLNIVGLCKAVNDLAAAARDNRLKPEDTQGGTFTLTNVGTFGSLMGTPIINQPQVAIMAVGAIKKRAVVIESADGDTIGIRHMMYLSLSYDHRIVDGSIGAGFLSAVSKEFESWDANKQWFHYL